MPAPPYKGIPAGAVVAPWTIHLPCYKSQVRKASKRAFLNNNFGKRRTRRQMIYLKNSKIQAHGSGIFSGVFEIFNPLSFIDLKNASETGPQSSFTDTTESATNLSK
jgi:hypothetical protein